MRGRVCNTLATSMTLTPAREAKRYLSVFIGFFIAVLSSILALNLALGERALGSVDTLQKASAWQQATHGVTYAPPLTNSRPFKALRLADRLPEINTLVLGASSLMGVTGAMFPAGLRAYNFSLTANATSAVIAEAEYVERHHAGPIRNFMIGLDWAIGMIYQPTDATALDLNPARQRIGYGAAEVPLTRKIADALSAPKIAVLGKTLSGVFRASNPLTSFQQTFFQLADVEYHCADGVPARDFDVMGRGTCLGFRYDGSWTFAGEEHLSEARASVRAQAAAAPSSQFAQFLCSTQGEPNARYLQRLGLLAQRVNAAGGFAVFILPPLLPGMEAEMLKVPFVGRCLTRTKSALSAWAREYGVTIIDAAASEHFGCKAAEFLDENHAWPECHARVLRRYWRDRDAGLIAPGLYQPAL